MTPPRVSIVIPHFNRGRLIKETVSSVKAQTMSDWEILIVDDGSTSVERLPLDEFKQDSRIRIIDRQGGPKGPSRCRNLGAQAARSPLLMFLDSDDLLAPWCLEARLATISDHPDHEAWIFPVMIFDKQPGDSAFCWNKLQGEDDLLRFLACDPPWHTSSPVWSAGVFGGVGGFNESVVYGDDAELHTRALLAGLNYVKFPPELPDLFIRRSEQPRITNSSLESALEQRLTRLREVQRSLDSRSLPKAKEQWAGQYFVEAEELLFNLPHPTRPIHQVLQLWEENCHPSRTTSRIVKSYFRIALNTRARFYLLLRVARRFCRLFLPASYFPENSYNAHKLDDVTLAALKARLDSG